MREVEIVYSFREPNNSKVSSGEANMVKFKNLCQKDTPSATNPPAIVALPVSQVPPQIVDPIVALVEAIVGVDPNSSEAPLFDKCNRNLRRARLTGLQR